MANTTTKPAQQRPQTPPPVNAVAVLAAPRLLPPEDKVLAEYDVNREGWRTLTESIFPAAKTVTSVMMALDYCKRRKLDVFKHPVHIVPIWNSQAGENGTGGMVETIWPGINELRTTAIRTGQYAGMDVPVFGPPMARSFEGKIKKWKNGQAYYETEKADVAFPEWCQITVYRTLGGNRVPFPGPRVYWLEAYARLRNDVEIPNSMWQKRANGQLEKCAEAAALRRAFPEELGSDYSIDEIGAFTTHSPADITDEGSATTAPATEPQRSDYTASPSTPEGATGQAEVPQPPAAGGDAPPSSGQPATGKPPYEEKASADAARQEQAAAAGVTDVEDQNAPLVFENYKRIGDFFVFSDAWLEDPARTPAQAKQWEEFYRDYIAEKAISPNEKVKEAIADTLGLYSAVLNRAREPGEDG